MLGSAIVSDARPPSPDAPLLPPGERRPDLTRLAVAVVRQATTFVGICDAAFRPVYLNRAGRAMIGWGDGPVEAGWTLADFFAPEHRDRVVGAMQPALLDAGQWQGDLRLRHLSDPARARDLSWHAFALRDREGSFAGAACFTADISDRLAVEAALEEHRRLLSAIVDHLPLALGVYDGDGALLLANERMRASAEVAAPSWGAEVAGTRDILLPAGGADPRWHRVDTVPLADSGTIVVVRDVDDLKRVNERCAAAEETTSRHNVLLEGINRIFRAALSTQTEDELGKVCLAVAEDITGAAFSFMGELDHAANRLNDLSVSERGWAAFTMDDPDFPIGKAPTGFRIHGIYGRVLIDEKSLIANDPANHPDRVGFPPGHPPLSAFLGVPLKHHGATIGMIGLGNRPGGFRPADAEAVELLAPAIVHALLSKRGEREREAAHRALAESSQRLRETEARFRLFAEHSSHLLWITDPARGTVEYRSPAYKRIWGEAVADAPPRVEAWLARIHPDDQARVRAWNEGALNGEAAQVEYRIARADGVTRWLRDTAFPIRDEGGRVVRIGGIAEDLTRDDVMQVYLVGASDDEARRLAKALRGAGLRVRIFAEVDQFLDVASVLAPGCALVDLRIARRAGLRVPRELRARSVSLPVVLIGRRDADVEQAVEAMKAGAVDYLTDPPSVEALRVAIAEAMAIPQEAEGSEAADDLAAVARVARLTPRERDVLVGLVGGGTNKSIAQDLGISPRTVELHRAQAMGRLGAASLPEALQIALRAGLAPPRDPT